MFAFAVHCPLAAVGSVKFTVAGVFDVVPPDVVVGVLLGQVTVQLTVTSSLGLAVTVTDIAVGAGIVVDRAQA
jgi:hypothetical protein